MPRSMSDTSYILGLHFGHDGAVCVLHDGAITGYVLRERSNRIKHALGITDKEIELALVDAGIDHEEIDFIAITSTQSVELLPGLIDNFSICLNPHPADETDSPPRLTLPF